MVKEGEKAPDFELMGDDGKKHKLNEFKGKKLVLYFYPKDDTPGCTIEAKDFSTHNEEIRRLGAVVVGVSKDDFDSHCKFRDKYALKVLILSDPESRVIKAYGAYGNKGIFGEGTLRNTYVIDENGKVIKAWERVQAVGHIDVVLSFLKS